MTHACIGSDTKTSTCITCPHCAMVINARDASSDDAGPCEHCGGSTSPPEDGDIAVCPRCTKAFAIGKGLAGVRLTLEQWECLDADSLSRISTMMEFSEENMNTFFLYTLMEEFLKRRHGNFSVAVLRLRRPSPSLDDDLLSENVELIADDEEMRELLRMMVEKTHGNVTVGNLFRMIDSTAGRPFRPGQQPTGNDVPFRYN